MPRIPIKYLPPSTTDLVNLKHTLDFTGEKMAELAAVAGGQQWRKYTGGAEPRTLGIHMAFLIAARLALSPDELDRITAKMREIGCDVEDITPARAPAGQH